MRQIKTLWRDIDWKLTAILTLLPIIREVVYGEFFSHHGQGAFASVEDFTHTGLEMIFAAGVGVVYSSIRTRYKEIAQINDLLKELVAEKTDEIRLTQKTSIMALATLAEYYDSDTGEHLNRIQQYVQLLATRLRENSPYSAYLQMNPEYINELALASILHDIGKTAIPVEILTKPGKLNDKEFELIKTHPVIAGEVLEKANQIFVDRFNKDSYLALARDIAWYHHEKWNGRGYPRGLHRETIPLSARIVAVADVYDALRNQRPYKEPWSHEEAVEEIRKESGQHFEPVVVEAFITLADYFQEISDAHKRK